MKYTLEITTDDKNKITEVVAKVPNSDFEIVLPLQIMNSDRRKAKLSFVFLWRIVRLIDEVLNQGE